MEAIPHRRFRPGDLVRRDDVGTEVSWTEQLAASSGAARQADWTRAELYQADPESPDGRVLIAFTNPIWVRQ